MRNILFFNTYHIGDVFWSVSFIKNIVESNPDVNFFFWIPQGHAFYKDINIKFAPEVNVHNLFAVNYKVISQFREITAINTWVRSFWEDTEFKDISVQECNVYSNYNVYKRVCEKLNLNFTLHKNDILSKLPETDLTSFLDWSNNFKHVKKIFYFNYLGKSGQATSIGSMPEHEQVISALSDRYKDHYIMVPDETGVIKDNVINCQAAFGINRDVTCENVIKLHQITNFCDYNLYASTGACFVSLNKDSLNISNRKFLLHTGQYKKYGDAMNAATKSICDKEYLELVDCQGVPSVLDRIYNIIPQ